jgi:PAS domain S-box-containing protein
LPAHGVQVVLRDLTAQKKQALWLSTLLDNMDDGIIAMDTDGLLTYMNQQAERILHWQLEELHGKNVHEHIHHHRPTVRHCHWKTARSTTQCAQKSTYHSSDEVFFRKDGSMVAVRVSNTAAAGRPDGGQCHHLCRCQRHAPARTGNAAGHACRSRRTGQERIPGHHEP